MWNGISFLESAVSNSWLRGPQDSERLPTSYHLLPVCWIASNSHHCISQCFLTSSFLVNSAVLISMIQGVKRVCLSMLLQMGERMTCTFSCMMGPAVEVFHAKSGKEVSYSPISLCAQIKPSQELSPFYFISYNRKLIRNLGLKYWCFLCYILFHSFPFLLYSCISFIFQSPKY